MTKGSRSVWLGQKCGWDGCNDRVKFAYPMESNCGWLWLCLAMWTASRFVALLFVGLFVYLFCPFCFVLFIGLFVRIFACLFACSLARLID